MAVASTYSTEVTNHKSVENTKNPTTATEGASFSSSATAAVAAADDDGSKYFMLPVHSGWSIKHIWFFNDAMSGGTDYSVGLYTTASTPVAVVSAAYTATISVSAARTTAPIDAAFGTRNITAVNQKVWEDAGATADSNRWYYLTLLANTVGDVAGDVTVVCEYSV